MTDTAPVECMDCGRLVRTRRSRARRLGEQCWRDRRRAARALVQLALPIPAARRPSAAGQAGPDLFTQDDDQEEATHVERP